MKLQALCILGLNPIFTKTQIKFPSIQDEKAVVYTTYTFVKNYLLPSTFIYHHHVCYRFHLWLFTCFDLGMYVLHMAIYETENGNA